MSLILIIHRNLLTDYTNFMLQKLQLLITRKQILTCFLLAGLLTSTINSKAQYVSTNGTKILNENGQEIFFTGTNLGNWLLWEGYLMMGDFNYRTHSQFFDGAKNAFGGDLNKALEFEHQWRLNYVTEQAIIDLKNLGFNSVRVPFHFNMFWDWNTYSPRDHGFQYLDRLVNWCRTHGVYILLDMHAAPGYQNPGDHSDNVESNASQPRETVHFWDGDNINIASQVWRHIANYYKNEPMIWGYDLINEPVPQPGREFELMGSLISLRNAIREVDNNHIIVAEGSWWGSDMQKLDWMDQETQNQSGINYRWDDKLVYQTHHYSNDVSLLDGRLAICNKLNVPMILGEYGESDNSNLRNMTDWCINNNVHYFPWSFKKMSHDRCLWTIQPNEPYNQLKNAINSNSSGPSSLYNDMIVFCQNNIKNGHSNLTWHQGWYDAVKPPQPCIAYSLPGKIEAEAFCKMSGIQTEATSDVGGGENVGWVDAGDWLDFTINPSNSGNYTITFRVTADGTDSKSIELQSGGSTISTVNYTATGGWQNWTSVSTSAYLNAGEQTLRVYFPVSSQNLNWINFTTEQPILTNIAISPSTTTLDVGQTQQFTATGYDQNGNIMSISPNWSGTNANGLFEATNPGNYTISASQNGISASASVTVNQIYEGVPVPGTIQAENYDNMNGIQTESTSDNGGGENIGWVEAGDWCDYLVNVANAGMYTVYFRVAADGTGSKSIQLQANNSTATANFTATGGWQSWETVSAEINLNTGSQTLRLYFPVDGINVNWIQLEEGIETPVLTSIVVSPSSATLDVGQTQQLTATGYDQNGEVMNINPTWNNADNNGLFTASNSGTFTVTASQNGVSGSATITVNEIENVSIFIEAEDYFEMSGVQTEGTSDAGGGLNVGWIDNGDWMAYSINIPSTGTYTVEYRVASQGGGGSLTLESFGGSQSYGSINITNTGGWQNWNTISHTVSLNAGQQDIGISATRGGWNINWIKITSGTLKSVHVQESLNNQQSLIAYPNPCTDRIFIKGLNTNRNIEVYNLAGVQVKKVNGRSVDVSDLPKGLYFLSIEINTKKEHLRFIKK